MNDGAVAREEEKGKGEMGIRIETTTVGPYPWSIRMTLFCEGKNCTGAMLIPPTTHIFEHPDGYIGAYRSAMAAGWKDTHQDGKRVFFGPCCSGK